MPNERKRTGQTTRKSRATARTPSSALPPATKARDRDSGASRELAQANVSKGAAPTQRHATLGEREAEYRTIFEANPDFIYIVDPAGNLLNANPALLQRVGLSLAEMQQRNVLDFFAGTDPAEVQQALAQLNAGDSLQRFEVQARDAQGAVATYEVKAIPVREGARITRILNFAWDISERKHMERALRESEAKYRTIFSASPDLIYLTNAEGRLLDANPAVLRRAGLSLEELRQMHFLDFFAGDDRAALVRSYEDLLRTRRPLIGLEVQAKNARGHVAEFEVNAIPLVEEERVTWVLSLARDITARKRAERELRATRQVRERIADTIPDILYLYDLTEKSLVYINRQIFTVLGYPVEEFQGKPATLLRGFIHPDDLERLTDRDARITTLADGEVVDIEFRFKHATGEWRSLRLRETIYLRTPDGTPAQVLGVAQDITVQRRLEHILRERVIDKEGMPARLREFRRTLRMSQAEFGKTFGGFGQSQISAYESGEVDISLGLILGIRAQGYPIEAVLGAGKSTVIDETVTYLPAQHQAKVLAQNLIATALQLLAQDRQTVERVLHGLGLPIKNVSDEQQKMLNMLVARTKSSD